MSITKKEFLKQWRNDHRGDRALFPFGKQAWDSLKRDEKAKQNAAGQ